MIDMLYSMGESVFRQSATQIFSIRVSTKDVKTNKDVTINAIACVRDDNYVNVFYRPGMTMGECNDEIVNSIGEIDLRKYEIFAVHTLEEFQKMHDNSILKHVQVMEKGNGLAMVPPNQTRADAKAEAKEKKKAAKK